MIFNLLLILVCILPIGLPIIGAITSRKTLESVAGGLIAACMLCAIPLIIISAVWHDHAKDLATVDEQQRIIDVYEKQRDDLRETLKTFPYPKDAALMNHDTPVASLVTQLGVVEQSLTKAREREAAAYKSIAATKRGPMSGVVAFVREE